MASIDDRQAGKAEVRHRQSEITAMARRMESLIRRYVRSDQHREAALYSLKTAEMWAVDGVFATHVIDVFSDGDASASPVGDEKF